MKVLILIPSRMASTRLPNKPMADIAGKPMICHVYDRAQEANIGEVVVACDCEEIKQAVEAHGGKAVLTAPELLSGSDRIWAGLQKLIEKGAEQPDIIINVQGDEPLLPPALLQEAVDAFELGWPDVVTFAHFITDPAEIADKGMVKTVTDDKGRAHYFSRSPIPHGATTMKRHIGLYAYRYGALKTFVEARQSELEKIEQLEQLRGLDLGLKYYVGMTDSAPIGVDTPEDLAKARELMQEFLKNKCQ